LSKLLDEDPNILSLSEKEKQKSLVFFSCARADELVTVLTERKTSEKPIHVERIEKIGQQKENKIQPLKVIFKAPTQAEEVHKEMEFKRDKDIHGSRYEHR